jgi:alpha-ketoglutarate-dependent taurine dioxygenase
VPQLILSACPPTRQNIAEGGRLQLSHRLSPAGGIAITGVDLPLPLPPEAKAAILAGLLSHHVVVFPGQSLSRTQQFAFAATFGEVEAHGARRGEQKRRDVAHVMSNLGDDGQPTTRYSPAANYHWHTDKPYHPAPPALTLLYAVEVPPAGAGPGGETEFANMALAYDALPAPAKRRIAGLRVAFHPAFDPGQPGADHPLVRTHPDTGEKALYLGNHATHVLGLPKPEGMRLLAELLAHATQRRFVYTHRWRRGDLLMWDNRCLLHRLVLGDALRRHPRIMHRSIVAGTVPF